MIQKRSRIRAKPQQYTPDAETVAAELKTIYQAPTLEQVTVSLHRLAEKWRCKVAIAVKSWEKNKNPQDISYFPFLLPNCLAV